MRLNLDKVLGVGEALELAETDERDDGATERSGVPGVLDHGELAARDVGDDLHPALVERAAAYDAEVVALEAVVPAVVVQNPAEVVRHALIDRTHEMLTGVDGVDVEQRRPGGGAGNGAPFAEHPGGADEVVGARGNIVDDLVHEGVDAVAELCLFVLEELVANPLDVAAGGFGYACDETPTLMPAAIYYAHRLVQQQSIVRRNGTLDFLRPDAKSQVTLRYENGKPVAIDTVVLSTQHHPRMSDGNKMKPEFIEAVIEHIIKPVLPQEWLKNTRFLINPTGRFVVGGPQGDCGLTGRKIIVDTYGGACPHGGGAFSGKDPSKVDRSAAYACRYVAKNIVAAGLASRCQVQVSYAIGVAQPINVTVRTFGTGKIADDKIAELVRRHFDLRPRGIIQMLDLLRPIYSKTAAYGHFGREEPEFTWERTDKAELLKADAF